MRATLGWLTGGLAMLLAATPSWAGGGGMCGTGGGTVSLPEPASIALLVAGAAGILIFRSRRRK